MARYHLIPAAFLGFLAAVPAHAAENSSVYTKLLLDQCRQEPIDPEDPLMSRTWWCEGYAGIPVQVSEGDERFLVSYGEGAEDQPAASQTLPAFNYINETLEWRLDPSGKPFATILRFFTNPGGMGEEVQILVITRLGGVGEVCHMGYVNASINADANALAREVADNGARDFDCASDHALEYGLTGDDTQE